jgi:hypothetical protein
VAGDPFEPELAAAAPRRPRRGDGRNRRAPAARSRPEHRRAAPLPLPASARAARRLRGDARRLAAGRARALRRGARRAGRFGRGARPPRRALGARGRPRRRRRPARGRRGGRHALAPASAAHWFAEALRLLPASAPARSASSFCSPARAALTAPAISPTATASCWRRSRSCPTTRTMRAQVARACAVESLLGRHEQAGARLASALERLPDQGSPRRCAHARARRERVWRARYEAMHEWAERAVARRDSSETRVADAAALAELALADSMTGAAERAESCRSEAAALVDSSRTTSSPATSRPRPGSPGWSSISTGTPRATRTPSRALAVARATGQGELFLSWSRPSAGSGASAASWPRRASCSTAASRPRACWATRTRWCGPSGPLGSRAPCGDVELALATAQESVDLSQTRRGLPLGRGRRRPRPCAARDGEPERAVDLLLGSAGGEELVLIAGSPRAHYLEC